MRFHNTSIRNILSEALNYGGIIVDVRSREEFSKCHIPMAINLPLEEIREGKISLPKGKIILLYCENGGGSASQGKAYEIVKEKNTPPTAKNSQLLGLFGVALVILIIALGYRSKNKDDYQLDNHDYEL